jgi:hypothetical protein
MKLCLTLTEERCLKAFENRMLRRILKLKTEEVTGDSRRLHNYELRNMY